MNAKSIFKQIKNSISNNSVLHKYAVSMLKTVLFQTIQFSISTQFSSIWPIERTLSSATTPGQSGPGSDSNEEVLRIPPNSSIIEASPSDCLMSYPGHSLGKVLPLCREAISGFYSPNWLSQVIARIPSFGQIKLFKHLQYLEPFNCANKWLI